MLQNCRDTWTFQLPRTPDTITETGAENRSLSEILPPWAVILHNDDHNQMDYVVASLVKSVPSLGVPDAIHIMLEAHNEGRAVVITCPLEPADLYRDRLRSFGLGATIEKS